MTSSSDPFAVERVRVGAYDVLDFVHPIATDLVQLLRLAASQPADRPYLIHGDRQLSFGELLGAVGGLAAYLHDDLGVRPGDRVAVAAANSIDWVLTAWATVALGGVIVGANAWWHPAEAVAALEICEPVVLVCDAKRWTLLADHLDELPSVRHVLTMRDGEAPSDHRVQPFPTPPTAPLPHVAIDPDQPATILFTSGTTGAAKGVIGTHRAAVSTFQNIAWAGARYFPTVTLREPAGPPEPPATVLSAPMFHVAGLQWGVMFPVATGGTVILNTGRYDARNVLEMAQRHRITSLGGVPTMMSRIVDLPDVGDYDLSSITSVSWGGAPPAPDLVERCLDTFENLTLVGTGYGLTETCGLLTYAAGSDYTSRLTTTGKPFPTAEVRICAAGDVPVPIGQEGEVQLRGPMVMPGYWRRPEATLAALTDDGWFRSGDLGHLDADGFLTLTGRIKELIIRGGENVYPVEIEDVLNAHPDVLDAAVVGRPHPDLGEEVVAVLQVAPGSTVTGEELRQRVASRLAAFKVPVEIDLTHEPLPRNAAGKLIRDVIAGGAHRFTETL